MSHVLPRASSRSYSFIGLLNSLSAAIVMKSPVSISVDLVALLPSLASARYLFPDLIANCEISTGYKHVREQDNGFSPSMKE